MPSAVRKAGTLNHIFKYIFKKNYNLHTRENFYRLNFNYRNHISHAYFMKPRSFNAFQMQNKVLQYPQRSKNF